MTAIHDELIQGFRKQSDKTHADKVFDWYEKNKETTDPWFEFRVSKNVIDRKFPYLTEEEKKMYAILLLCPYNNDSSRSDLRRAVFIINERRAFNQS